MSFFRKGASSVEFLIVGLGNPGDKYEKTRHNAGFIALDYIAAKADIRVNRLKHYALTGKGVIGGHSVFLAKPQTYMNNSGNAVREIANFYKLTPDRVVVIVDDYTLDPGGIRIRRKGSDGGHNGIKSIIAAIGQDFPRIKLGIGDKPNPDYDLADYVLGKLGSEDYKKLMSSLDKVFDSIGFIIGGNIERAMNLYNG